MTVVAAVAAGSPMLASARSALRGGVTQHAPPLGLGCMQQYVRGRRAKYVPSPSSKSSPLLMECLMEGGSGLLC